METSELLELLDTGYIICLVLTIVFFLISVLLFFVFNIKQVYMILSGKAAKRDIRKLEEENFNTGRLSKFNARNIYDTTGSLYASQEFPKTERMDIYAESKDVAVTPPVQGDSANSTTVLGQNDTTVLNGEMTTVLNAGATTVLNQNMQGAARNNWAFRIIKKEMHIHTEEVI